MSKYYNVNIDSGTAAGPYTVYHTEVNPSNIATLFSNAQPAVNLTYYSIVSNNGVIVIVPDDATRIILYNQECDTYEDNLVTYTITAGSSNVNEGESITLNVTTKNVPENTVLYWKINYNNSSSDPDFFTSVTGTTTIVNKVSTFSVSLESDLTTEGSETFYVELRTDSISGTIVDSTDIITINDTSRYYYYLVRDTYNCEAYGGPTAYYKVNTDYGNNKLVKVNGGDGSNKWLERDESQQNGSNTASFVDVTNCVQGTPTYSINEPSSTVDEGATVTFTVSTTYVRDGTTLYWKVNTNDTSQNPTETNDFTTYTLSGTTTISNGSGGATFTIIRNDLLTEGSESFYMELRARGIDGPLVDTSGVVTINDTSTTPPTYSISGPNSVNENASAVFNVTTTDVPDGTILYWRVNYNSSTDSSDFGGTSGDVTINNNSGTFSVSIANDSKTEGTETFRVDLFTDNLRGTTAIDTSDVVQILDTSTYPGVSFTYLQTCNGTSNASGRVTFTDVTGGDSGPYEVTINGTDWSTWTGGSFRIDNIGDGNYNLRARDFSENYSSISTITVDCYRAPTYAISASPVTINEPGSVTFTVTTQYVPNGTTLYWVTEYESGSSSGSADFNNSTGTVTINSAGTATFNIGIEADNFTEGTETFKVRLRTGSTSGNNVATSQTITIGDTSVNTQPIWVSRNYITCYSCTNYTVYQNTNPNSPPSIKDYYRIGESGPIQAGAPTGGNCNTDPNYTETFGCNGCTRYKTLTKTNPCSSAESPKVEIVSLNSVNCYQEGVNCCAQSTTPNYVFEGSYGCSGCAKYEILVDRNVCTSGQYGSTTNGSVVDENSAFCHQTGDCCGQSTASNYLTVSSECIGGFITEYRQDANLCSPTFGPQYQISVPTNVRCYTYYGAFATTCSEAIAENYTIDIYTDGTSYRMGSANGSPAQGTYYSKLYMDNNAESDYRYSPLMHTFESGQLNLSLIGCQLYDNTGQIT